MKLRSEIIMAALFGISALCMNCESAKKAIGEAKVSVDTAESATAPLLETHWNLVALNGNKIPDSAKDLYILLRKGTNRVEGNGGCNTFSTTFVLKKNNEIEFGEIVSTRLMCPVIQYETEFFKTISVTDHYSLQKDTLSFLKGKNLTLARFVPGK